MAESMRDPAEQVYFLDEHSDSIRKGQAGNRSGAELSVVEQTGENSYSVTNQNRADVFTGHQLAEIAGELLDAPADGEEMLLDTALDKLLGDQEKLPELHVRLMGRAAIERFTRERDEEDYGLRSVEQLVGSPDTYGSNMWKVEDLITLSKTTPSAWNTLDIAKPNAQEMIGLSPDEALRIREKIVETNRQALDQIYNYYDVSFENARVYERTTPAGEQRVTVYPSATENINFIEMLDLPRDFTPEERAYAVPRIQVQVDSWSPSESDGFGPAI